MNKFSPGSVIDQRFEILEEIGHGGMGVVYRARQKDFSRDVAIKVLRDALSVEPEKMKRFQREAHLVAQLDHPNIVKVFAIGQEGGLPYIAMEFLHGRQLSETIERDGPITWTRALPLFMQACDALAYAHEQRIIHRDIKPSNMVVTQDSDGNFANVKIVDFGIAKSLSAESEKLTRTEMVLGSVFYLSPGQFQGRAADPLADIYSLGCTFFEVLSGKPPFVGDTIFDTIAQKTQNEIPKVNSICASAQIPASMQQLLDAMMQNDAEHRPQSASEVKQLLGDIACGKAIEVSSVAKVMPVRRKRNFAVPIVAAVSAIVGIVAFAWVRDHTFDPQSTSPGATQFTSDGERNIVMRMQRHTGKELAADYADLAQNYTNEGWPAKGAIAAEEGLKWLNNDKSPNQWSDLNYALATAEDRMGSTQSAAKHLEEAEKTHGRSLPMDAILEEISCGIVSNEFGAAILCAHKLLNSQVLSDDAKRQACVNRALGDIYPVLICSRSFKEAYDLKDQYAKVTLAKAKEFNDPYSSICAELLPLIATMGIGEKVDEARWQQISQRALRLDAPYFHELFCDYVAVGELLRQHPERATQLVKEGFDCAAAYTKPKRDGMTLLYQKKWMRQFGCRVQQQLPREMWDSTTPNLQKLEKQVSPLEQQYARELKEFRLPVPPDKIAPGPKT